MPNGIEPKAIVPAIQTTKPRIKSKTYWFGGLLVLLAAVLQLPEIGEAVNLLPENWQELAIGLIGIVVMILREVTNEPVNRGKFL